MISIIDHKYCNTHSIFHALRAIGKNPQVTDDKNSILDSEAIILPGVGAFGPAMETLRKTGTDEVILKFFQTGKKLLAICVGMQMLASKSSEFGEFLGLGLIPGEVKKIRNTKNHKVPNVGWRETNFNKTQDGILSHKNEHFYYTHSFEFVPEVSEHVMCHINYADKAIVTGVHRENLYGTQFHPEKSGLAGLSFLKKMFNE